MGATHEDGGLVCKTTEPGMSPDNLRNAVIFGRMPLLRDVV